LYAGKLFTEGFIIPEKYKNTKILSNELECYEYKDNRFIDIVDKENGLILAERIDEVSEIINQEFNDLCNIEFKKKVI
jgi:hypothetical protein